MNPQHQAPVDYLNQISPQQQKTPFRLTLRMVIIGAVGLVILVIIFSIIIGAVNNSRKTPWEQLSAKLSTTSTVVANSTTLIKNSQLRSLNSDLKIYLTNTTRDLETPLKRLDIDAKKLPASVIEKEQTTGITDRLENARLNAKYDSTYAREMSYQLATILSLYQQLYNATTKEDTKTFLKTSYDNLLPTQKALSEFNTSTE